MPDPSHTESPSRYLVGIDLGTTNCAVAYVDTAEASWAVHDLPVLQVVAAGEVETRDVLPSFLYQAAGGEFAPHALQLPWSDVDSKDAVGLFAREHGAAVPGRLVVSAKSWLSHRGVDRTAPLLPWHGATDVEKLSPVQASSRYLAHIRAAWDHRFPDSPLAAQDVVLTVPASFDEVARELTIQAARDAGLVKVVLVEEPQAAFYAWIDSQGAIGASSRAAQPKKALRTEKGGDWERQVRPGQKILVCDVGGGTSDFTLIRVRPAGQGKVLFHRVAVGEHLILGGDNLDLALAHHVEKNLVAQKLTQGPLPPHQFAPLVRICRAAKETLLGVDSPELVSINLAGSGSRLIGGSLRVDLTRDDVRQVLVEGFLPRVPLDARPVTRRSGFQEFGLPYAPDAGITRYLAAFLSAHRQVAGEDSANVAGNHDPARPDMVLFNGGLFESPVLRQRLLEVLESWFVGTAPASPGLDSGADGGTEGEAGLAPTRTGDATRLSSSKSGVATTGAGRPSHDRATQASPLPIDVLRNDRLDLAVARGAAYYGMVRRGRGVRISGGLAHSYYLGLKSGADGAETALCLLPAGVEEGQSIDLIDRTFDLLIRQPAEFPLYYSATRTTDRPGQLLAVDPEQLTALPPIRTVLQSGRKTEADSVAVHLHAKLTEIGTLEMWCSEEKGERQWKLQFDVRSATRTEVARHAGRAETEGFVEETTVAACRKLIRAAFDRNASGAADAPAGVVKRLEQATGMTRHQWPPSLMRSLWETLIEIEPGRRTSVEHEARWLSLAGFCLRPGYGLAVDDWRAAQTWRLYPAGVYFPKNELCRAEWWIFWRRIAGGLTVGQQATLADPLVADWRTWIRKAGSGVCGRSSTFQFGPHESAEVWRLLGSLELLKSPLKNELGSIVLERLAREKAPAVREALLFCLGRLGARVPVYGPLNALIEVDTAQQWARRLIEMNPGDERSTFALVQLTRRTGDRYRDVSSEIQHGAISRLIEKHAAPHLIALVGEGGELREEEQRSVFGESLPRGLRIE